GIFVPSVLVIALLTFAGWSVAGYVFGFQPSEPATTLGAASTAVQQPWIVAVVAAIALLGGACPCAPGLATPPATMVGTGQGAESGVLIRGGESLERVQAVRTVVLDKTGTITTGKPELTDVIVSASTVDAAGTPIDERSLIGLVAGAESVSEHPLARAIVAGAAA